MKEKYVLWLDESGDFIDEASKKKKNYQGSLVGGFLLKEKDAQRVRDSIRNGGMLDTTIDNHATEMTGEVKAQYVLSVINRMVYEFNAVQVVFENRNYVDGNRVGGKEASEDLYLRIIAGGLLRLLRHLNAICESVVLDVLIAHRMDKGSKSIRINDYEDYIKAVIEEKRKEGNIALKKDTELNIEIDIAGSNHCLQLADFVCNTRLTRNSIKREKIKILSSASGKEVSIDQFLNNLYDDEDRSILYSMEEQTEECIIERMLSGMNIADAVIEYYQTQKILSDKKRILKSIFTGIRNTNYRILKSQMKTLSRKITSIVESNDNYEASEEFLKKLHSEFVEKLKGTEAPYIHLDFNILRMLSDCYLREGDTPKAHEALDKCREILDGSDYSMEEFFLYYQLKEKEALLAIDEFDYENGIRILEETGSFLNSLMGAAQSNEYLKDKFSNIRCEYYGDVLCMQLLAMMSLQRQKPEIYDEMVRISDIALKQYPNNPEELERHRQYRSFIEMEHGDCKAAIKWLAEAKCFELTEPDIKNIQAFLAEICRNEVNISCQWYLMYYLLIMEKASKTDKELADRMYRALCLNKKLLEISYIGYESGNNSRTHKISTESITESKVNFIYHPLEIVYWKWGSYIYNNTSRRAEGKKYIEKAIEACFPTKVASNRDKEGYLAMNIKGVAISSEYLMMLKDERKQFDAGYKRLIKRIESILQKAIVSDAAKTLISMMKEKISSVKYDGKIDCEKLKEASRIVPF